MERRIYYTLLHGDRREELASYLHEQGWLEAEEDLRQIGPAGDGNMNLVLRLDTGRRTFIVKQSRPWVEKYPHIPAPRDRVLIEAAFYQAVSHFTEIAERMPRLLGCDEQNFVALLEDLGETADFTYLYNDGGSSFNSLPELCKWLAALHGAGFDAETRRRLENLPMRQLNHEHLFHFPLLPDNGLDLDAITPGLTRAAESLKVNGAYRRAIAELGGLYLENGPCLLHGDFYPGSWVHSVDDVWVIDPEFCFFGPPEFDVGIFISHLLLAGRPPELVEEVFDHYGTPAGFSRALALRFAGMEIMRRLIGVAQLPIEADLERKVALLAISTQLVLAPESFPG
jgi:5-methylthioribose kinase